jgi:hypothetical protein
MRAIANGMDGTKEIMMKRRERSRGSAAGGAREQSDKPIAKKADARGILEDAIHLILDTREKPGMVRLREIVSVY